MRLRCIVWMLWIGLLALPAVAQNPPRPPQRPDLSAAPSDESDAETRMAREAEKKASEERYAALKTDTDKLLKLAVELKGYVDKSNEHVLSLDVVKKADEIEKLARSVKDKMKGPN
jgi:nitric oxide reductase activation protein